MSFPQPNPMHGGQAQGPPGLNFLCICLAALAAVLGAPLLFKLVGPFIQDLTYQSYGSEGMADFMYFVSFALSGVTIFAVARITIWYALTSAAGFGALRMAGI